MVVVEGSANDSYAMPLSLKRVTPVTVRSSAPEFVLKQAQTTEGSVNQTDIFEKFILYTDKCHVPFYDYKDPEVLKKYYSWPPQKCPTTEKPFIFYPVMNETGGYSCVGVNETLYKEFHETSFKLDDCRYKQAVRQFEHFKIDYFYEFTESKPLTVGACPPEDLLWIECGPTNTYQQPLFLPEVKPVDRFIRGNDFGQKPLHVLVLGLDSVSRLNAHRQFPKTMAYLKTKQNIVELFGYNKIGVNSAPNQIPLLTGIPFKNMEIEGNLANRASQTHFDNLTRFLWDDFDSRGYRTMYYEEQWIYGLFLYPPLNGFLEVSLRNDSARYHSSQISSLVRGSLENHG